MRDDHLMGVLGRGDIFEDIGSDLVYMLGGLSADGKALFGAVPFLLYLILFICIFVRQPGLLARRVCAVCSQPFGGAPF